MYNPICRLFIRAPKMVLVKFMANCTKLRLRLGKENGFNLSFDTIWDGSMAQASFLRATSERRSDDRTPILRPAVLRVENRAVEIKIDNLTRDGCKITSNTALAVGSEINLGLAGIGQVKAAIVWNDADSYGCVFHETLPSGSVTAATLNNVNQLDMPAHAKQQLTPLDVKWGARNRLLFAGAATSCLWIAVFAVAGLLI